MKTVAHIRLAQKLFTCVPTTETGTERDGAPILDVVALSKKFGGVTVVQEVPRGGILSIIGPNRAEKTSLPNMISGFYKPLRWSAPRRKMGRGARRRRRAPG